MLKDYLVYNDEDHEYSIQYDPTRKIVIPSTTQLLQYAHVVDSSYIDPHYAIDGTEIHTMTEMVDNGLYIPELVEDRVHAALVAYEQFLVENDVEWEETEEIIFHEDLFYAGTKDRLGTVNGVRYLVDLKSGNKYRWHILQLAGYFMCEPNAVEVSDLYLGACDYKFHPWKKSELQNAIDVFASIAKIYWYNHPMDYKRLLKIKKEIG